MRINLKEKSLVELKMLLIEIESSIRLIEREKRQREKARQGALERVAVVEADKRMSRPIKRQRPPVSVLEIEGLKSARSHGPKYMHPASRTMVWDGEGEQPQWLTTYLEHGGSWGALENTAQLFNERRGLATAQRTA